MFKIVAVYASVLLAVITLSAFAEPPQVDASSSKVRRGLEMQINLALKRTPFADALHEIARLSGLNIVVDWPALRDGRIAGDIPVTLSLEGVAARTALDAVLDSTRRPDTRLTFIIRNEVVRITTEAALNREIETRAYPCAPLLPARLTDPERAELESAVTRLWRSNFHIFAPSWRHASRTKVGPREEAADLAVEIKSLLTARRMEQLATTVRAIAPRHSWQESGGPGTIQVVGDTLVVTQTVANQQRIADLLEQLRQSSDDQPRIREK
jgi:hypothetical protein